MAASQPLDAQIAVERGEGGAFFGVRVRLGSNASQLNKRRKLHHKHEIKVVHGDEIQMKIKSHVDSIQIAARLTHKTRSDLINIRFN